MPVRRGFEGSLDYAHDDRKMREKNLTWHEPTRIFFGSGDFDSSCI
jgi:hypothetical protein